MRKVSDLTVKQTRLFPHDAVPLNALAITSNVKALQEVFSFKGIGEPPEGRAGLLFQLGEYDAGDDSPVIVQSLLIEPRRITFDIAATSETANAFFETLRAKLAELGGDLGKPIILSEETRCVATLKVESFELLSPAVREFVDTDAREALRRTEAEVFIAPLNVRFEILYQVTDPVVTQHQMALSPKILIVEPRLQTPQSERRYFCQSPCDSSVHLRLIDALEARVLSYRKSS